LEGLTSSSGVQVQVFVINYITLGNMGCKILEKGMHTTSSSHTEKWIF